MNNIKKNSDKKSKKTSNINTFINIYPFFQKCKKVSKSIVNLNVNSDVNKKKSIDTNNKHIKLIINIVSILFILILIISLFNLIKYHLDDNKNNNQLELIKKKVVVNKISEAEIIEQTSTLSDDDPYWKYIKMNLIDVNFNKLKTINDDVKGWIQVNNTNINYPFVQTSNNDFYLSHSFDKTKNIGGWVFLDHRNNLSNLNERNTIIYAHGMKNKTMFGSLRNILNSDWLKNNDNHVIKLSTENENTLWQVFSVYHIPTTSDYIQTAFYNNDDFYIFADKLINRSTYNFNTTISPSDRILTLSTCYDDNNKVVLHAKLIKRYIK